MYIQKERKQQRETDREAMLVVGLSAVAESKQQSKDMGLGMGGKKKRV